MEQEPPLQDDPTPSLWASLWASPQWIYCLKPYLEGEKTRIVNALSAAQTNDERTMLQGQAQEILALLNKEEYDRPQEQPESEDAARRRDREPGRRIAGLYPRR